MIHLIRHTKPDVPLGICYGQTDLPLADTFAEEFDVIRQKLKPTPNTSIISSPLQRCHQLANALFEDSAIELNNDLKEMHFGDWEMQAWNNIEQTQLKQWGGNFVNMPSPNGESFNCLNTRVLKVWSTLDWVNQDYVLVTHAGVIRVILSALLKSPLEKAFTLDVRYGEVIRIKFADPDNCTIRFV